jgi:hypothetical protein
MLLRMMMTASFLFLITLPGSTVNTTVTFTPGVPNASTSSIIANPNTVVADGSATALVQVILRDSQSNLVANWPISLSGSGSNNVFGNPNLVSDANGMASTTLASTLVQNEQIQANSSGAFSIATSITFTVGPANYATSSFTASPTTQIADGTSLITTTLTLRDAQSRPINNALVTATASGSSTTVGSNSGHTNSSGVRMPTYRSTVAQNENATASASGLNFVTPLVFIAGPVSSAQSSITANPNNQISDGNSVINLTVTLADAQGNGIANVGTVFGSSGSSRLFAAHTVQTNNSGVSQNRLRSYFAGNNTIFAQAGNILLSTNANYTTRTAYCAGSPNYVGTTIGASGIAMLSADINHDGYPDIVTLNQGAFSTYLFNTVTGSFSAAHDTTITTGAGDIVTFAHGDFDGDTYEDIAVVLNVDSPGFTVFFGDGTGTFGDATDYSFPDSDFRAAATADFNNDGYMDLALVDINGSVNVRVFMGANSRVLNGTDPVYLSDTSYRIITGDVNRDGNADFAVGLVGTSLEVFLGGGDGSFGSGAAYANEIAFKDLSFGDFNGDGCLDIAAVGAPSSNAGNANAGGVWILLNNGNGTFSETSHYLTTGTSNYSEELAVYDANGDGKQDILFVSYVYGSNRTADLITGDGAGSFAYKNPYPFWPSNFGLLGEDFNHDKIQDIVRVNSNIELLTYTTCN